MLAWVIVQGKLLTTTTAPPTAVSLSGTRCRSFPPPSGGTCCGRAWQPPSPRHKQTLRGGTSDPQARSAPTERSASSWWEDRPEEVDAARAAVTGRQPGPVASSTEDGQEQQSTDEPPAQSSSTGGASAPLPNGIRDAEASEGQAVALETLHPDNMQASAVSRPSSLQGSGSAGQPDVPAQAPHDTAPAAQPVTGPDRAQLESVSEPPVCFHHTHA